MSPEDEPLRVTTSASTPLSVSANSPAVVPATQQSFWGKAEVPISVAAYSTCSISMIILNKQILDKKQFSFPFVVIFFQNLSAILVVLVLKQAQVIDYPKLEAKLVRRWLPLTGLFVGMLVTSLLALKTMSIPLQTLIKSLAIILTAVGDHVLFGHVLNTLMLFSFLLLITGSILGARSDTWLTPAGLFWSVTNVFCTSTYQLYMKGMLNDLKSTMGKWGPVYYNNLLSLPPLIVPVLYSWDNWTDKIQMLNDTHSLICITLMILVSAIMTMASFWCMRCTSPTTYGVIGGLNKIPLALLGMYIFDQYPTLYGAIGIAAALIGGLVYIYAVNTNKQTMQSPLVTPHGGPSMLTRLASFSLGSAQMKETTKA
eukprot:TRINITY_DN852_c1_g3_i1.p1 TRINITY_DN852_c1_g3~~TRINITY_DN852_c1_g3_i1.p1  ORF type:complete len:371 (+),score=35.01 TRINITY_DN852_c1_g3_i1:56-1168(+)